MQARQLRELTETANVIKVVYDEYELTLTFDNGTEAYITAGIEYDSGTFEISTNIERDNHRIAYENNKRKEDEEKQRLEAYKQLVLESLSPDQRINVLSLLNK